MCGVPSCFGQGSDYELRFSTSGFGFLCLEGRAPQRLRDLFRDRLVVEPPGHQRLLVRRGGAAPAPSPDLRVPSPLYCTGGVHGEEPCSLQSWCLPYFARGLRNWWTLGDLVVLFHPDCKPESVAPFIQNTWGRWARHLALFGPIDLLLQRGIDRSGRNRHWRRHLVEHTVSTTGLLALHLVHMCLFRVPPPQCVRQALADFLKRRLKDGDYTLDLSLDRVHSDAYSHAGGAVPPELAVSLPLRGATAYIAPFLEASSDNEHVRLRRLFEQLHHDGLCDDTTVPLVHLLQATYQQEELQWLARALVHQVARLIDSYRDPADFSDNPLQGDRLWGSRADPALSYHLAQGLGGLDEQGNAPHVEAAARDFCRLRKKHKRWSKRRQPVPGIGAAQGRMLSRYLEACKCFLRTCTEINIACDGSRVGGKEILLVAVLAKNKDGVLKTMWAPPQARGERTGSHFELRGERTGRHLRAAAPPGFVGTTVARPFP